MPGDTPDYYFRVRENGALVFRVDPDDRMRRLDMEPIAVVNTRNGEVKPQGDRILSRDDIARMQDWMTARLALLAARETDDILRTVDHLNLTAQWAQSKATDEQLDQVSDALLMAMHDLRSTLVRRLADRARREGGAEPNARDAD